VDTRYRKAYVREKKKEELVVSNTGKKAKGLGCREALQLVARGQIGEIARKREKDGNPRTKLTHDQYGSS
jgi:hypothetical protein